MSRRWCHCGAPLWRPHGVCRVCWLVVTLPRAQEYAGGWAQRLWTGDRNVERVNSTDDTAATSRWLPRGGAERWLAPEGLTRTESDRLEIWLASAKVESLTSTAS